MKNQIYIRGILKGTSTWVHLYTREVEDMSKDYLETTTEYLRSGIHEIFKNGVESTLSFGTVVINVLEFAVFDIGYR